MNEPTAPATWAERLAGFEPAQRSGYVTAVVGTIIRALLPDVSIGDLCGIERAGDELLAEVVGFDRQDVLLMPLGSMAGLGVRAAVRPLGASVTAAVGEALRGRVIDARGLPLDGAGPIVSSDRAPLASPPPNPMRRQRITRPLSTGVRAIDGLLTLGRGQRVGILAAAGAGKSTLLGALARGVSADRVIVALIGERGREVRSFIEDNLGDEGRAKCTVVVSTSDEPAMVRVRAAAYATALAEAARRRGEDVVLLMDSVTRYARALRDIGLAAGEPPGRGGFPASVYAALPGLLERAGTDDRGSITAFYTVLVAGDDLTEPVADETMSLLDGHLILSRRLTARGHYPAIDILQSKSRLMSEIVAASHMAAARRAMRILALYEQNYDKISLGLYVPASDEEGRLVARIDEVNAYLRQEDKEAVPFDQSVSQLTAAFGESQQ